MLAIALIVFGSLGGSTAQSSVDGVQPKAAQVETTDRAEQLIRRTEALPDVARHDAEVAARTALLVETADVPAELLIAIAWGESRFVPTTITGRACGLVQTIGASPSACKAMTVPIIGMLAGIAELRGWLRIAHGDLRLALLAYACGYSAFDGTCSKQAWPGWVLHRARSLGLLDPHSDDISARRALSSSSRHSTSYLSS